MTFGLSGEVRHDRTRVGAAELAATILRAAERISFEYRPVPMRAWWRTESREVDFGI